MSELKLPGTYAPNRPGMITEMLNGSGWKDWEKRNAQAYLTEFNSMSPFRPLNFLEWTDYGSI